MRFNTLLEIVLNLCAQIVKANLKGPEEMTMVLDELGLEANTKKDVLKMFQTHYIERSYLINNAYEKE